MEIRKSEQGKSAPLLVNSKAACNILGVCERTLWGLMKEGRLRCVRVGRCVRYDVRDLMSFVDSSKS